jgi:hypothetical protein
MGQNAFLNSHAWIDLTGRVLDIECVCSTGKTSERLLRLVKWQYIKRLHIS